MALVLVGAYIVDVADVSSVAVVRRGSSSESNHQSLIVTVVGIGCQVLQVSLPTTSIALASR
jgi:hypothetical protein